MRPLQAVLLVPAVLRGLPRVQLAAGTGAAIALVWLLSGEPDGARTIMALQYAALALSLALAPILHEPGAGTLAAVAPRLSARRALTLAVVSPGLVAVWAGLVRLTGVGGASAAALTLQLAAMVLLTLAIGAAWTQRRAIAGPLVALGFLGAGAAAPAWALRPDFGDWRWDAIWIGLTAGALALLRLASRDPAWATGRAARA